MRLSLLRLFMRTLGLVAPSLAGRQAFVLCFTPRIRPIADEDRRVLDRASRFDIDGDGRSVVGYRWRSSASIGEGTVLLAHGWNSNASRMVAWVEPLLSAGYDVVGFDMPAHGDSGGKRTNGLEMAWALGAVAQECGPVCAVVGHSAGAFATAMAAAGGHLVGRPPVAAARLVLISPVDNPRVHVDGAADLLGLGRRAREHLHRNTVLAFGNPMEDFALTRIPGGWKQPTMIFHDPADPEIEFSQAEAIVAALPNARLTQMPGCGHHRIARDPEVISSAIRFIGPESRLDGYRYCSTMLDP